MSTTNIANLHASLNVQPEILCYKKNVTNSF